VPACCATAPSHSRSRRSGLRAKSNTSFNVKGEPIVETPRDAMVCFLTTGIDHLVMHDTLISKNGLHGIIGPAGRRLWRRREHGHGERAARVKRPARRGRNAMSGRN
jgi:hypothetical protein